jgi:prepilin-type N-terminal cleavage/methylation domain-containing protein
MSRQSGVTLVELMIAVAVIGILSAIVVPSYSRYAERARATNVVNSIAPSKVLIADAFGANGTLGCTDSVGNPIANCSGPGILSVSSDGVTVTMTPTVPANAGQTVVWACALTPASTPKVHGCGL